MDGFPKFSTSAQQGELGVALVFRLFSQKFKWIFRRTHQEQDFGIDGYIDIVNENGQVTGRSFAVQIKCGSSYFKSSNYGEYWYIGERKHLNYLLNHPVPVILILVNPDTEEFFWVEFNISQTESHGNGWRIPIPQSQKLTSEEKKHLKELAGEEKDYTDELEVYWQMNQVLSEEVSPLTCVISRSEIETRYFDNTVNFFERLLVNNSLARKCQGKVEINIYGYENDVRELYEIEEVRSYIRQIEPIVKYWFFFLETFPTSHGLKLLMSCRCRIQKCSVTKLEIDRKDMVQFFSTNFVWLNEITDRLALSLEDNQQISEAILKYFNLNA